MEGREKVQGSISSDEKMSAPLAIVVMGVSGCGKSTIGALLARALGCAFLEGDAFHPAANVAKMAQGVALQDADRWPWLHHLASEAGEVAQRDGCVVLSCSALRQSYRQAIGDQAGVATVFIHLAVPTEELERRMGAREGHFMPTSLLQTQLATLEPPGDTGDSRTFVNEGPTDILVAQMQAWLSTLS